jgi:hypothetical protein
MIETYIGDKVGSGLRALQWTSSSLPLLMRSPIVTGSNRSG